MMKYIFFATASLSTIFPAVATTQNNELEIIEVYAQKRAQKVTDVAISVSKIDGELLSRRNIKDTTGLGTFVPNLKITQNAAEGTTPAISIRGIGLIDYNTSNSSPIGVYVDNVTTGSANNQIVNLFDIESIEVLKGPQGTLFGNNTTGGAILVRSNRPTNTFEGYLRGGLGNQNTSQIEGMVNLPLSEQVSSRFAISHNDYEYTSQNLFESSPTAGLKQTDWRALLSAEFDQIDLLLKIQGQDWSGIVQPVGSLGIYKNPQTKALCAPHELGSTACFDTFGFNDGSNDFYDVMVNNNSPHETNSIGTSLELNWQLNSDWLFTSISAFNHLERDHAFNCDGSPARLCEGELGLENDDLSQELRLSYQMDDHYLVIGAYYLEQNIAQNNFNDIFRDLRGLIPAAFTTTFIYDNQIDITSASLFAQLDYHMTPTLSTTFGLRYSDEKTDYDSEVNLNYVVDPSDLNGQIIPHYIDNGTQKDDHLSFKFALNYQLAELGSLYYSLANGHKIGGYYGGFLSTEEQSNQAAYGPEEVLANEIGAKLQFFEQSWILNAAIFHYDYQNQQVFMNQPSQDPNLPPIQLLENVASSTIYGLEIDSNVYFNEQFSWFFGVGYLPKAEFDEYQDPLGNVLTNNRLPFTSKWDISSAVNFHTPFAKGELNAQISVNYQSDFYFDQNENEYAMQSGYSIWDGYIHYEQNQWQTKLWVSNLFEQEYSNLRFDLSDFLGMLEDFKGEGRRYGVSVSYHF